MFVVEIALNMIPQKLNPPGAALFGKLRDRFVRRKVINIFNIKCFLIDNAEIC